MKSDIQHCTSMLCKHRRLARTAPSSEAAEFHKQMVVLYRASAHQKERGTYLVREGDKAESCIVLLSGFVYWSKVAGSGARQILSIHMRGDLIDLQNSILGSADHSVQTLTRVEVASIRRTAILELAAAYPGIALALWRDTLIDGSVFREWILNVGHRSAHQRISHLLCEIITRQQAAGLCDGPTISGQ
jgi:CRP-like cAMP-binding protein